MDNDLLDLNSLPQQLFAQKLEDTDTYRAIPHHYFFPQSHQSFEEVSGGVSAPQRRWSCDDSQATAEMPASYYQSLGKLVHNHMHMTGRNFDCVAAAAAATSPDGAGPIRNQRRMAPHHVNNQSAPSYQQDSSVYDNDFYGNGPRSVSAPTLGTLACAAGFDGVQQNGLNDNDGLMGADFPGRRRFRTNFTEHQSNFLEESFRDSHYPDHKSKKHMAHYLNIPEDRITVWFQNRRAKWRRKEMRDKEKNRPDGYQTSCSFDYSCFSGPSDPTTPCLTSPVPQMTLMSPFVDQQVLHQHFVMKPEDFHHQISADHTSLITTLTNQTNQ